MRGASTGERISRCRHRGHSREPTHAEDGAAQRIGARVYGVRMYRTRRMSRPECVKTVFWHRLQAYSSSGFELRVSNDRRAEHVSREPRMFCRAILRASSRSPLGHTSSGVPATTLRRTARPGVPLRRRLAETLASRYRRRIAAERLLFNEIYLAILYRPVTGNASGMLRNLVARPGVTLRRWSLPMRLMLAPSSPRPCARR